MKSSSQMFAAAASTGVLFILAISVALAGCGRPPLSATADLPAHHATWTQPDAAKIPNTPDGDAIRLGKLIFDQTPKYAPHYVGNRIACGDCHIKSGTARFAAPMIDLPGIFPRFNKRAGHVISLQERLQECFVRSENGTAPDIESPEIKALVAYILWLSPSDKKGEVYPGRGFVRLPLLEGDIKRGKIIYTRKCAACHRSDGAGVPPVLPPVWGVGSYNDGAGMNNPQKMAAFLVSNMPQNHPGTLTPHDAYDVAAYIHSKPRPRFNQVRDKY